MAAGLLLACFVCGLVLVAAGAWVVTPAAGLIVAGAELVLASVGYARSGRAAT